MFSAHRAWFITFATGALLAFPAAILATDVDGPDDCERLYEDWGDAPEDTQAYPGVIGRFPTCSFPGPAGTQELGCAPISTAPGATGHVRHVSVEGLPNYWLGCPPVGSPPLGVDREGDGKVNSTGAALSFCNEIPIDCVEPAFGLNFGQDECTGSDDAGIKSAVSFITCTQSKVTFDAYHCGPNPQPVFLNVLIDWNRDGDWNDNFLCGAPPGPCAYEWAVKNVLVDLLPGCNTITTPAFLAGPLEGEGWMRITISDDPVDDDFPWLGSAGAAGQGFMRRGETEDYPVRIDPPQTGCPEYEDFGDAPEEFMAYPGIPGHFPTCLFVTGPGTQDLACAPISTAPGPTGFVRHLRGPNDPAIWLGCTPLPPGSIDSEHDGKSNDTGGAFSNCSNIPVDCVENAFGMMFGQDECYGDTDAGIVDTVRFTTCEPAKVKINLFNCEPTTVPAYLNVLVDWNRDGDWNDNFFCDQAAQLCAYEWPVKNLQIGLPPGCTNLDTPAFIAGPFETVGWMRVTVTLDRVTDDFPWNGSASTGGPDFFPSGETEDYPVRIAAPDPCDFGYEDFGDAPEGITAYASGTNGSFPTCLAPGPVSAIDLACGIPLGTPPGPAGYVRHIAAATDPNKFWLGCGSAADPSLGVDSEPDGKINLGGASISACDPGVFVDCVEPGALAFSQDECYGDFDAALGGPLTFGACSTQAVTFNAYSCAAVDQQVYLNVLIDWNQDGDWNDNAMCLHTKTCAPEWAVKNAPIGLAPGCGTYTSPNFTVADSVGRGWMRITLTRGPVKDAFPWNGSVSEPIGYFESGETEDYIVSIIPSLVDVGHEAPGSLWMGPLAPNPARVMTAIRYGLPTDADVALDAFDLNGRRVRQFAHRRMPAGQHVLRWDFRDDAGRPLPAGIYLVKLRVDDEVFTRRVIRIQ